MTNAVPPELLAAAQTRDEMFAFIEAFARVNVDVIRAQLSTPIHQTFEAERLIEPDWTDHSALTESGIKIEAVDEAARAGTKYLHIQVALDPRGHAAIQTFLAITGLSDKLRRSLFPVLSSRARSDRTAVASDTARLNAWLDWVRRDGFDPTSFVTYQTGIKTHGRTQNLTGAIGATGAAIAFVDAIREAAQDAIIDAAGPIPPPHVRSPTDIFEWRSTVPDSTLKAILLRNRRAIVFASSKDANIFQSLGAPFQTADEALRDYNRVRKDAASRRQSLHEFAVGEVKTATDAANLHERMGLASRETQTELRTDRFLMMALLNREIIEGGEQGRTMNNRDVRRFSHVFNLHHCWGWDGGRDRHPDHWRYFVNSVREWCGL